MIEPAALALGIWTALSGLGLRPPEIGLGWWFPAALVADEVAPAYRPEDRQVSNWRAATRRTLEPAPLAIAAALFVSGRPIVTRCVKLNNPWCIKRARWAGELGGDDEDHTAFASTEAGADAAAALLRTYYVSIGLRSALDIVRRWAPAECRIGDGAGLSAALAVRGLANTLRARYLASRGRSGTAQPGRRRVATRVSVVPLAPLPSFRVPDLAPGMGERPVAAPAARPRKLASASPVTSRPVPARSRVRLAAAPGGIPAIPSLSSCGSAEGRIQHYGLAIATALGVQPGDDLKLFDAAGDPTANLLPVLVAMSAIELGYLHAGPELVEGAVDRMRVRLAQAASAVPVEPPPRPPSD